MDLFDVEQEVIQDVIKMIDVMIESTKFDNYTLEELKQRLR